MPWIKMKEGTFLWEGKVPVPTETWEWIDEEGQEPSQNLSKNLSQNR